MRALNRECATTRMRRQHIGTLLGVLLLCVVIGLGILWWTDERRTLEGFQTAPVNTCLYNQAAYRQRYPDLDRAFGSNVAQYLTHFRDFGLSEGRVACSLARDTCFFDHNQYAAQNPTVAATVGLDYTALRNHYLNTGLAAGRPMYCVDCNRQTIDGVNTWICPDDKSTLALRRGLNLNTVLGANDKICTSDGDSENPTYYCLDRTAQTSDDEAAFRDSIQTDFEKGCQALKGGYMDLSGAIQAKRTEQNNINALAQQLTESVGTFETVRGRYNCATITDANRGICGVAATAKTQLLGSTSNLNDTQTKAFNLFRDLEGRRTEVFNTVRGFGCLTDNLGTTTPSAWKPRLPGRFIKTASSDATYWQAQNLVTGKFSPMRNYLTSCTLCPEFSANFCNDTVVITDGSMNELNDGGNFTCATVYDLKRPALPGRFVKVATDSAVYFQPREQTGRKILSNTIFRIPSCTACPAVYYNLCDLAVTLSAEEFRRYTINTISFSCGDLVYKP
jgi:hypothetical protein